MSEHHWNGQIFGLTVRWSAREHEFNLNRGRPRAAVRLPFATPRHTHPSVRLSIFLQLSVNSTARVPDHPTLLRRGRVSV